MAKLITLRTFSESRGNLTVIEDEVGFSVLRVFYIYGVDDSDRGGHRHRKTKQALICINGSCTVMNDDGHTKSEYILDSPRNGLILDPRDWHVLRRFSKDAILLVLASERFDEKDYIFEPYA